MTGHGIIAEENFKRGYNCAQSVLLAFGDLTGLEEDTALRLSSSFGGGLGRLREVCGAVSGGAMVLGLLRGYDDPSDSEAKKTHYRLIQDFADRFRAENGSIICRELLSGVKVQEGNDPEQRTAEYYKKRPCPELVRQASDLIEELLEETACGKES